MWVASSFIVTCIFSQKFSKIKSSSLEHRVGCSLYFSSMSSRQFAFGDFSQRPFWFSLANSSACFSSS